MIALKFGLPIEEVSKHTVRSFLMDPNDRGRIVEEVCKPEKIARFIELLRLAVEQIDVVDPDNFVEAIVNLSEKPLVGKLMREKMDYLGVDLYRQIWRVLRTSLERREHTARLAVISSLAADCVKVGLGAFAVDYCLRQSGFYKKEETVREEDRWCTNEEQENIVAKWIDTVRKHATLDGIFSLNGARGVFFLLKRLNAAITAEIVNSLLVSDSGVDTLVRIICDSGTDSTKGRFAHVTDEFLDSIGGTEVIRARVQMRLEMNLEAPVELRAMYNSVISGKKFYLVDGSEGRPF